MVRINETMRVIHELVGKDGKKASRVDFSLPTYFG